MTTRTSKNPRSDCPINIALEALGDAWSLLIVRDLMFKNRNTFKDFLEAEEHIASNILVDRLKRLELIGLIDKTPDPDDARRYRYRLTEAGIDLAPMMTELILWSARHFKTGAPPDVLHQMEHARAAFLSQVRATWKDSGYT